MKYPELSNANVLVTGGLGGLGKSIVSHFVSAGAKVTIASRSVASYSEAALNELGAGVSGLPLDLCVPSEFDSAIESLKKTERVPEILVNNAGYLESKNLLEAGEAHWDQIFNTNLKGLFFWSQKIASLMKEKGHGTIVNAHSFASEMPSHSNGVYAASKAALSSLTKSMAAEWAVYGLRVNGFSPGVIETEMTKAGIEKRRKQMIDEISLRRLGNPDEVSKVVLFLASKDSSYLNGATIDVTGGKLVTQNPGASWPTGSEETQR